MQYTLSLLITPLLWHWPKHKWRPVHTFFFNINQTLITWGLFLIFLFFYKLKCTFLNNKKSVLRDIWQDISGTVSTVFPEPCLLDLVFPLFQGTSFSPRPVTVFHCRCPTPYFYPRFSSWFCFGLIADMGKGRGATGVILQRSENKKQREGGFWMLKSFLVSSVNCVFTSNSCPKRCEQEQFNLYPRFIPKVCLLCTHRMLQHTEDRLQGRVQHQDVPTSPSCDHSQANAKILQLS